MLTHLKNFSSLSLKIKYRSLFRLRNSNFSKEVTKLYDSSSLTFIQEDTRIKSQELKSTLLILKDYAETISVQHDYKRFKKERKNVKYLSFSNIMHLLALQKYAELYVDMTLFSHQNYVFTEVIFHNKNIEDNNRLTDLLYFDLEYTTDHMLFVSLLINKCHLVSQLINHEGKDLMTNFIPHILVNLRTISREFLIDLASRESAVFNLLWQLILELSSVSPKKIEMIINIFTKDDLNDLLDIIVLVKGIILEKGNEKVELNDKSPIIESLLAKVKVYVRKVDHLIFQRLITRINLIKPLSEKHERLNKSVDDQIIELMSGVISKSDSENEDTLNQYNIYIFSMRFESIIDSLSLINTEVYYKLALYVLNLKNRVQNKVCGLHPMIELIRHFSLKAYRYEDNKEAFIISFLAYNCQQLIILRKIEKSEFEKELMIIVGYIITACSRVRGFEKIESLHEFIRSFQTAVYSSRTSDGSDLSIEFYKRLYDYCTTSFTVSRTSIFDQEFVNYLSLDINLTKQITKI